MFDLLKNFTKYDDEVTGQSEEVSNVIGLSKRFTTDIGFLQTF
jgi:hypothetical protein